MPADSYRVKLEAARIGGYQTTMMAVIRDAHYVAHAGQWLDDLTGFLHRKIAQTTSLKVMNSPLSFA